MQTLEMYEAVYRLMLESAEKGKRISLNATKDTSYINIMNMAKKGLIDVIEDYEREWEGIDYNSDDDYYEDDYYDDYAEDNNSNIEENESEIRQEKIIMHDIKLNVNKEKMEEELKRIKARLEKRKETRIIDKALEK